MNKNSRILILGSGLVGSSLHRILKENKYSSIYWMKSKQKVDLTLQDEVNSLFLDVEPEYVFLCAAKVGGILANQKYKADFIYQNLMIQTNVIDNCYRWNVKKLLFIGSSCIYPNNFCLRPIKEEYLMTGPLEETNDAYAIAKIAGLKMCQSYNEQYGTNFISVMPSNLYGPGDTYHQNDSHVIPSLIMKIHDAKINNTSLIVWGTGNPRREFLYVDDLSKACIMLMEKYNYEDIKPFINIGIGSDISIKDLVLTLSKIIGFDKKIIWDDSKPDGTFRKLLDTSRINKLGWKATTSLETGLKTTYNDYLERIEGVFFNE